jgi:hypothetical protein
MSAAYIDEADVTAAQRRRTLAHRGDLLGAACDALGAGFDVEDRHEVLFAPAKTLGLVVWGALADDIIREARRMVPRTY